MLGILAYVIVFSIIVEKGYQMTDFPVGSSMIKVKGVGYQNRGGVLVPYDEHDVVIPALEPNGVFLTTNAVLTAGQTRSTCGEPGLLCSPENGNCLDLVNQTTAYGIATGVCLPSNLCEVNAWCPIEDDTFQEANVINGVDQFTVFVRSNVEFQKFGISVANDKGTEVTFNYNLYSLEMMLAATGYTYDDVKAEGAMLLGIVNWDCNFDKPADECDPEFEFIRLDDPNSPLSSGFNYRYVEYTRQGDGTLTRDLTKAHGVRIVFMEGGEAGKFDIVTLTVNLGAGLALLGVATLLCDIIVLYFLPQKQMYKDHKYELLYGDDASGAGVINMGTAPLLDPALRDKQLTK